MKNLFTRFLPVWTAITLYLVTGFLLLRFYQYQINPDGISYINNARLILQGQFLLSVNDHWNPLISWLLAPFLVTGLTPQLAFKGMNLLIGAGGFILLHVWLERWQITGWIRWLVLFTLMPMLLWMAFAVLSPDLLVALCLMLYLSILHHPAYFDKRCNAVLLGLVAGLSYLAKYYALPFIAVHLFAYHALAYHYERPNKRRRIWRHYAMAMLVFCGIVVSWLMLQSAKYADRGGLGNHMSSYVFAFLNPHASSDPFGRAGLVPPPHASATSAWDDPRSIPVESWYPWQSPQDAAAYINIVRGFFSYMLGVVGQFTPFAWGIFLIFLYFGMSNTSTILPRKESWKWLLPFLIYAFGYLLIWVEERYLWFLNILLLFMVLQLFVAWPPARRTRALHAILVITLLSFAYFPGEKLVHYFHQDQAIHDLAARLDLGDAKREISIASNKHWVESLYICYYRNWRYYGSNARYVREELVRAALAEHQIDGFLFWGERPAGKYAFLNNYPDLTQGRIDGVHLFQLEKRQPSSSQFHHP